MATVNKMMEKDYLKEVYTELEGIKKKIETLRDDLAKASGCTGKLYMEHDRHLLDMVEYVDWKLQVLEKGTSFDWKAAGEKVESDVSVGSPVKGERPDIAGGYLGG
jgi:hypothetical protein